MSTMTADPQLTTRPSLAGHVNVAEPFLAGVREHPGRTAVVCGEDHRSYAATNARINRICALLRQRGVRAGDRVAYLLPNCATLIEVYYAIQKLGAIAVPLNVRSIAPELEHFLTTAEASVLLFAGQYADVVAAVQGRVPGVTLQLCIDGATAWAEDLRPLLVGVSEAEPELFRDAQAVSRIQFTGGSTGAPKAAERTHRADLVEFEGVYGSNRLYADEAKVVLIQCPLEHHGGHSWYGSALSVGATLVLCSSFDPEVILAQIERHRVSYMILLPPTTYARLMSLPGIDEVDLSSVRLVQSSAGGTSPEIVAEVYRHFPNAVMNYGWGQTETGLGSSLVLTREMVQERSPRLASIGTAMPLIELKVVDEDGAEVAPGVVGECVAYSEALMRGYHNAPELTAAGFTADGWWRTGDLMARDSDGYLYLKGRKRELVKSGGENVFVGEVEGVLREHPAVLDAMVFGQDDPVLGEAVAAAVELRPGFTLTLSQVQAFCRERLASYKKPRSLTVLDSLGRDFSGKLRRDEVIRRCHDAQARQASVATRPDLATALLRADTVPEVWRVVLPVHSKLSGTTNAWLAAGPQGWLLVDPGAPNEAAHGTLLRSFDELGIDAADIFLTHEHADHAGLVARWLREDRRFVRSAAAFGPDRVRERFTAAGFPADEVAAYESMQRRAQPEEVAALPALTAVDGQEFVLAGLRAQVVATPGHTDGHACLFLPDSGLLFGGDHVLFDLPPALFGEDDDPVATYFASLDRVASLPVRLVLPGHGRARTGEELAGRVRRLKAHHERRLAELLALVKADPGITAAGVTIDANAAHRSWTRINPGRRWSIASTTVARLDHLAATGAVVATTGADGLTHYQAAEG